MRWAGGHPPHVCPRLACQSFVARAACAWFENHVTLCRWCRRRPIRVWITVAPPSTALLVVPVGGPFSAMNISTNIALPRPRRPTTMIGRHALLLLVATCLAATVAPARTGRGLTQAPVCPGEYAATGQCVDITTIQGATIQDVYLAYTDTCKWTLDEIKALGDVAGCLDNTVCKFLGSGRALCIAACAAYKTLSDTTNSCTGQSASSTMASKACFPGSALVRTVQGSRPLRSVAAGERILAVRPDGTTTYSKVRMPMVDRGWQPSDVHARVARTEHVAVPPNLHAVL